MIYTPSSQTSDIVISVNGTVASSVTVDRTQQTFSYRFNNVGSQNITFSSVSVSKTISITVTELGIDVEAEISREKEGKSDDSHAGKQQNVKFYPLADGFLYFCRVYSLYIHI